jgi:glycine/D-amino acid oxidase-like deaminating enzyme
MKRGSGTTASIWMKTAEIPSRPALKKDVTADVCVVGAGIAGLTTAYLLAEEGKSVVVLDDGPIAAGETSRTTAHLANALDDRYFEIESLHGEKGAQFAAASHTAGRAGRGSRKGTVSGASRGIDGRGAYRTRSIERV